MSNKKKVMLFYADWCGHCKNFMPVWEQLKSDFEQKGIDYEEHESQETDIMEKFGITGFPTIKIMQDNIVSEYNGIRDRDAILNYVGANQLGGSKPGCGTRYLQKINMTPSQQGGGGDLFKCKYNKYKNKHYKAKQEIAQLKKQLFQLTGGNY